METRTIGQKLKRFFIRLLLFLFFIGLLVLTYLYWGTYSSGVRSGIVVKVSSKGMLFKTYEGQLNLDTFGALKSANAISESFEFSVAGSERDVMHDLEASSLTGERVSLHYVERYLRFPWRGDTRYFVTKVDRKGAQEVK